VTAPRPGLFAGAEAPAKDAAADAGAAAGCRRWGVHRDQRARGRPQRISEVLLRILNGSLFELAHLTREKAGLPPLKPGEATRPS
jgi:cytochrome c biogenesis protein